MHGSGLWWHVPDNGVRDLIIELLCGQITLYMN